MLQRASERGIPVEEAVLLGAADSVFYEDYFFSRTTRQQSAGFHVDLWKGMENNRQFAAMIFRGGAKTTKFRIFASKRVAYGISRTILFVGKSQDHAIKSVDWLKSNVLYNEHWSKSFGLAQGSKWTEDEIEIIHTDPNGKLSDKFFPTRVLAVGITGSVRGINIQDYRPDLIIVDDPCDEENTATPEQREKISNYFFGAIKESLAPASEEPNAALLLAQTPLDADDLVNQCFRSGDFSTLRVGILTNDGEEPCESQWPARWTKEEILKDKQAAINRNQLSLWLREKMCKLISRETCTFRVNWLQYWSVLPPLARYVMAIDPAPVQSDESRMRGEKTDLQAVMVCCYWQGKKFVVEYATARDEDPEELARNVDRLARKYPILRCGVEGVAYQRTLKWFLEREMRAGRLKHLRIVELNVGGAQSKFTRITQAHTGRASSGSLYIHSTHSEFKEQFENFPNVKFKDLLDASAMCDATFAEERGVTVDQDGNVSGEEDIEDQRRERGAP